MDRPPPPVYLAGPDVFRPDAIELGRRKKEICAHHGLEGRFPLDMQLPSDLGMLVPAEQAKALYLGCTTMMDDCVAGLANLTPFRGTSADVGTAFELGYLTGQGKPVFAYTGETAHYQDRVDQDGLFVEPFGLCDNLMLEGAAMCSGSAVVRAASTNDLAAMVAFEECVRVAAATLL